MAKNVRVEYREDDGMLHFIVDPSLVVGVAPKSGSEYVCQSERFGEPIDNAPGWRFNLAVWVKAGAAEVEKPKPEPVVKRSTATPFGKAASVPVQAAMRKDIAPGKSGTVTINRVKG